jgi:tungstate transport system substrate-binding protein
MPVNPAKFPNVKIDARGGKSFADLMVAPDSQKVIGQYGVDRFAQQIFVPDLAQSDNQVGL